MKIIIKKTDILLIACLIFLAFAIWFALLTLNGNRQGGTAVIRHNGATIRTLDLSHPQTLQITTEHGTNTVQIKNNQISVTQASCRDGLCKRQPPISQTRRTIICLPNRLVIEIKDTQGNDAPDAIIR
jgi:hypothetical protein